MKRDGSTRAWFVGITALVAAQALGLSDLTSAQSPDTAPAAQTLTMAALSPEATPASETAKKPNIVVILGDDIGLMDLGTYGGEAATPNIEALAARGAIFTHYRASPLCSPSRAMLLTGMDNHLTGVATIPEVLPDEQKGKPGYTMALEEGVLTLADHLRAGGYRTLMSG